MTEAREDYEERISAAVANRQPFLTDRGDLAYWDPEAIEEGASPTGWVRIRRYRWAEGASPSLAAAIDEFVRVAAWPSLPD